MTSSMPGCRRSMVLVPALLWALGMALLAHGCRAGFVVANEPDAGHSGSSRVPSGDYPSGNAVYTPPPPATPPVPVPVSGKFTVIEGALGSTPTSFAIGDCNGDGRLDLLALSYSLPNGAAILPRQPDGTLGDPLSLPLTDATAQPFSGTFADLDGDGAVDLLLGENGGVWLLHGHGDCTFDAPVAVASGLAGAAGQLFVTDIDLDGLSDIAAIVGVPAPSPDQPNPMEPPPVVLLLARGDGSYTQLTPPATPFMPGHISPFATFWEDFDGDGTRDFVALLDTSMAWMSWGIPGDFPSFQRDDAVSQLLAYGDPMSINPLDYDRDGHLDYFVAHFGTMPVLMSFNGRSVVNQGEAAALTLDDLVDGSEVWGTYAFDADLDGWVDLLSVRTKADNTDGPAVFFHNNRDGTFANLTKQVLSYTAAARKMTCGDVLSNGHVLCYAQPDFEELSVIIQDDLEPAGNWIGIRLQGTVSSPEAEGARVSLAGANPPQVRYYGAQSPFQSSHDRALLMAVGKQTSADVDVTWPSGLHQHVAGLAAHTYTTITEPKVVALSKRVAKADGVDTVDITVDATLAGHVSAVTMDKSGPGTWLGEAQSSGGVWKRTLQAPASPGDTRIVVSLGGQTLVVRPRVIFAGP